MLCFSHAMIKREMDPKRFADMKEWLDMHYLKSDEITPDMMCKTCQDNAGFDGYCYKHAMINDGLDPDNLDDLRKTIDRYGVKTSCD